MLHKFVGIDRGCRVENIDFKSNNLQNNMGGRWVDGQLLWLGLTCLHSFSHCNYILQRNYVVCDPNQVSGNETKVQFQYLYWSQFFFSETETFFFKKFQFLFNISHDFPLYTSFYKLEKNRSSKMI